MQRCIEEGSTHCDEEGYQEEYKHCSEQCKSFMDLTLMDPTSDEDPNMSPAQFLDTQRQTVAAARRILSSGTSCTEMESGIAALSLWPDGLTSSFWQIYRDESAFEAAKLSPIYEGLKEDTQYLRDLCDSEKKCAHNAENCHVPPVCPGSITTLKKRVCTFQNAIGMPEL